MRRLVPAVVLVCLLAAGPASAHDAPFFPVDPAAGDRVRLVTATGLPATHAEARLIVTHPDGSTTYAGLDRTSGESLGLGTYGAGDVVRVEATGEDVDFGHPERAFVRDGRCPEGFAPEVASLTVTVSPEPGTRVHTLTLPRLVPELTEPGFSPAEQRFVELLNAERAALGRAPLEVFQRLNVVADAQATTNDVLGYRGHAGRNCDTPDVRALELGLGLARDDYNYLVGENAHYSSRTPEDALASWKASPGHWAALTTRNERNIGVAQVGINWIAIVATPAGEIGPEPVLPRVSPSFYADRLGPLPVAEQAPVAEDDAVAGAGAAAPRSARLRTVGVRRRGRVVRMTVSLAAGARGTLELVARRGARRVRVTRSAGGGGRRTLAVRLSPGKWRLAVRFRPAGGWSAARVASSVRVPRRR